MYCNNESEYPNCCRFDKTHPNILASHNSNTHIVFKCALKVFIETNIAGV